MTAALARPSMLLIILLALLAVFALLQLDLGWNAPRTLPLPKMQAPVSEHAIERHGTTATLAHQCLDGGRQGELFWNPKTERRGVACWLDDRWGIVILDKDGNEITAFVSDKLETLEDVIEYFARQGYQ